MNCECPIAGFCQRHQTHKSQRDWELCQGINCDTRTSHQYREFWDNRVVVVATNKTPNTSVVVQQAKPKQFDPVPHNKWPLAAKSIAAMKIDEDKGVGDTIKRLLGTAGKLYQSLFIALTGSSCKSCGFRQQKWNQLYPYEKSIANKVQIIVKSFRRFKSLIRFIESVKSKYPDIQILVADDSLEDGKEYPAEILNLHKEVYWVKLPFDSGLSAGRNRLVEICSHEYILVCDDDYVFDDATRLEDLLTVLESNKELSLAAGLVRENGREMNWRGVLFQNEQSVSVLPLESEFEEIDNVKIRRTDLALNFFLARRESLLKCPWDENLKIGAEHLDFFLSRKKIGEKSCYVPSVSVLHDPEFERCSEYDQFRDRTDYRELLKQKWGFVIMKTGSIAPEDGSNTSRFHPTLIKDKPNIIVMGVGHSGTSILAKMLLAMGWQGGEVDDEYTENIEFRRINEQATSNQFDSQSAQTLLRSLKNPWVLKDPRFCEQGLKWLPLLRHHTPLLIWITRNPDSLEASYTKRGEGPIIRGLTREQTFQKAQIVFERWPHAKIRISLEEIAKAVSLFDVGRV